MSSDSISAATKKIEKLAVTEKSQIDGLETITLQSVEGELFEVPRSVAMEFKTVKTYFDAATADGDGDDTIVPLPNVESAILAKIVAFCTSHAAFRADKAAGHEAAKKFDSEFVKDESSHAIKEMILAANYLDYKLLMDLLNQTIADRIANKSVEYVRAFFGIQNDFTPEEEEALRQQNAWAFEGVDED